MIDVKQKAQMHHRVIVQGTNHKISCCPIFCPFIVAKYVCKIQCLGVQYLSPILKLLVEYDPSSMYEANDI